MVQLTYGRVAGVVLLLAGGCSGDEDRAPGISDCQGAFCAPAGGGTGTTPQDEAGVDDAGDADADAAIEVVELSGEVVQFVDSDFSDTVMFEGFGYLRVPKVAGDEVVEFGLAGATYTASDVVAGPGWFTIVPDASLLDGGLGGGVLTTYAYLDVPSGGSTSFALPLVPRGVLSTIYAGFLEPTVVRGDAAQVILSFERKGQPLAGVTLTGHPTAEAVAFNEGVQYTTAATETGLNGVALLVNVFGTGPVSWLAEDGAEGSLTLVQVQGQASFVRIEVPEES